MRNLKFGIIVIGIVMSLTESSATAQIGGVGGQNMQRPKRRLHKSSAPALSPALNLLPGAQSSFAGQFLLRQVPQEQALRQYQQTGKALDKLQQEVTQNENQIRTGVKSTGHRTQFMNTGGYFPGGRGRGR